MASKVSRISSSMVPGLSARESNRSASSVEGFQDVAAQRGEVALGDRAELCRGAVAALGDVLGDDRRVADGQDLRLRAAFVARDR